MCHALEQLRVVKIVEREALCIEANRRGWQDVQYGASDEGQGLALGERDRSVQWR